MPFARYTKTRSKLSTAIISIRKRLDLNQRELGELVGCSPNTISQYEGLGLVPESARLIALMKLARGASEQQPLREAAAKKGLTLDVINFLTGDPDGRRDLNSDQSIERGAA